MFKLEDILNNDMLLPYILEYFNCIDRIGIIRSLNKQFRNNINIFYKNYDIENNYIYSNSVMVNITVCSVCGKKCDTNFTRQIYWRGIILPPRPVYISCNSWKCNLHILKCYNKECNNNGKYLLYKKYFKKYIDILRSSGKIEKGVLVNNNWVHKNKDNIYLAICTWMEDNNCFEKGVDIKLLKKYCLFDKLPIVNFL